MDALDTLGLVVISPSSSHTTGAARISRITLALLGVPAMKADIFLHGSSTKTCKGHGTDKTLITGIMGVTTDDSRIRKAPELAREQGLEVSITIGEVDGTHPSTARVTPADVTGNAVSLLGSNIGGGNILVRGANSMEVSITGQHATLIVLRRDAFSTIATVTEVMADARVNIYNLRLFRWSRGGKAVMIIEIDGSFGPELNEEIKVLPNIFSDTILQPIQLMKLIIIEGTVFMEPEFDYSPVASIVAAVEKSGLSISAIILRQQAEQMEQTGESIYEHMRKNYQVMTECIDLGCNKDLKSVSRLAGGSACKMRRISENGKSLTGSFLSSALYCALAVLELNAAMGWTIVASTAGSCDILPAALLTMRTEKQTPKRDCIMSLFIVSAVGMVIVSNAFLTSVQDGCQAECGSAATTTAAIIVELVGNTPKTAKHAIIIVIKNVLGLVYDPVTGLVEIPCIKHDVFDVVDAFVAAELTLIGIESAIPADEIIQTIKKVGDAMSSTLKGTAEGGLAATLAERRLHEQIFGTVWESKSGCSGRGGCSS